MLHLEDPVALSESRIRFLCFGKEVGEEGGTPHLQGYVEFFSTKRRRGVLQCLGARLHVEVSAKDSEKNYKYCSKTRADDPIPNEYFFEWGVRGKKSQGKRTDLNRMRDAIQDGHSDEKIANDFFGNWLRYEMAIKRYRGLIDPPITTSKFKMEDFPVAWTGALLDFSKSVIIWGSPGCGKTQFALMIIGKALMVSHIDELQNYNPNVHDGIVFDDMSFNHIPVSAQIHLTDTDHERSINIRYGLAKIPANTRKIFTTNTPNGLIFDLSEHMGVKRRVDIHHMDHFRQ